MPLEFPDQSLSAVTKAARLKAVQDMIDDFAKIAALPQRLSAAPAIMFRVGDEAVALLPCAVDIPPHLIVSALVNLKADLEKLP